MFEVKKNEARQGICFSLLDSVDLQMIFNSLPLQRSATDANLPIPVKFMQRSS